MVEAVSQPLMVNPSDGSPGSDEALISPAIGG